MGLIIRARSHAKGLAKLGNFVAETLFPVTFPGVAKLAGNYMFCAPVAKRGNIVSENK